jgi:hypothetical protein
LRDWVLSVQRWVGLQPKPDFFIYLGKPEPDLSPIHLVNSLSPKNPIPKNEAAVWSKSKKIRPGPPLVLLHETDANIRLYNTANRPCIAFRKQKRFSSTLKKRSSLHM